MDLVLLPPNLPPGLSYRGGSQIAFFRGLDTVADDLPQDWLASTVVAAGETTVGLTMLDSGRSLADEIAADPVGWLGADHVARAGVDTKMLVKLLDAGERLPVHAHPDDEFAEHFLGRPCGKTEAWFMLEPATVHVGFNRPVRPAELAGWVEAQDVDAMLGALNELKVPIGSSVVVPAGVPHVIGEGAFLVEIQQPTDLSLFIEWEGAPFDSPRRRHLGLPLDVALGAIDLEAVDANRLKQLVTEPFDQGPGVRDVLAPAANPYFRVQRVVTEAGRPCHLDAGYSVLVVLSGQGELGCESGTSMRLRASDTVLVAHRAGILTVDGDAVLLRCRPPEL